MLFSALLSEFRAVKLKSSQLFAVPKKLIDEKNMGRIIETSIEKVDTKKGRAKYD